MFEQRSVIFAFGKAIVLSSPARPAIYDPFIDSAASYRLTVQASTPYSASANFTSYCSGCGNRVRLWSGLLSRDGRDTDSRYVAPVRQARKIVAPSNGPSGDHAAAWSA